MMSPAKRREIRYLHDCSGCAKVKARYHQPAAQAREKNMTEEQWRNCADPWEMLMFLEGQPSLRDVTGKTSARKLRLLGCAILREIRDKLVQDAVEVAERFVDGKATQEDLYAARKAF